MKSTPPSLYRVILLLGCMIGLTIGSMFGMICGGVSGWLVGADLPECIRETNAVVFVATFAGTICGVLLFQDLE